VLAAAGLAQNPDPYAKARAAIEQSVEKQRASVRTQIKAGSSDDAFFTVPWVAPQTETAAPPTQPECEPVPEEQLGPLVEEISRREGLTPDLLRAVIRKESRFLPCAVSSKGAQGLMQLMPATASDLGVRDPFDPKQNVSAGAKFLRQLLSKYGGDLVLALGAYNAGPGRVDSLGRLPLLPETVNYVQEILDKLGAPLTAETQR
jgi:soluble lytic murein transglycosylase-like protein